MDIVNIKDIKVKINKFNIDSENNSDNKYDIVYAKIKTNTHSKDITLTYFLTGNFVSL